MWVATLSAEEAHRGPQDVHRSSTELTWISTVCWLGGVERGAAPGFGPVPRAGPRETEGEGPPLPCRGGGGAARVRPGQFPDPTGVTDLGHQPSRQEEGGGRS